MAAFRIGFQIICPVIALGLVAVLASGQPAAQPAADAEELTRGPVHEAFGKPVTFNPKPGLIIPKEPPAPVEELPPEEKPEGDNMTWIPGYWSYDEERSDFIWVSGFWRAVPPERQWVAGYWHKTPEGHQWTSGYWAPAKVKEAEYLAPPPESLETGPSTQPPTQDHTWVPGCWVWHDTRYVWRPGYWLVAQPGWIWVPAHYVWTPCGYVFCDGYWDYSLRKRGVLFAPVYINRVVYTRPGYVYSPTIIIDGDVVTEHFFVRPAYGHYYFGDYYATTYVSVGITPWFSFHYQRACYDPVFAYYECHYRRIDPGWSVRIHADFTYRRDHVDARPPRTFVAQQTVINNINKTKVIENKTVIKNTNVNNSGNLVLAKNIKEAAADKQAPVKFEKVAQAQRQELSKQAKEVRQATDQRIKLENEAAKQLAAGPKDGKPLKLERPSSPVVAKAHQDGDKDKGKSPPPLPASAKQDRKESGKPLDDQKGKPDSGKITGIEPRKSDNSNKPKSEPPKDLTKMRDNPNKGDSKGKSDAKSSPFGQVQGGEKKPLGSGANTQPPKSQPPAKPPPKPDPKKGNNKDKKDKK
jgi:hypothetical protein